MRYILRYDLHKLRDDLNYEDLPRHSVSYKPIHYSKLFDP